ncbi:peroxisomal membrane protein pex14 [Linderina macrospora]|uniref:Peroxisomal membrane protein pex14 n=1 Tax=Linderina macrospora TaxID=4868 RepID=A0ACC1J7W7_9FUNG|nr:peroxisomal membrane protein pex14 [Linderina macrospora]
MSDPATQQPQEALRQDVIESAVRFLTDSKVASSTLAKKISFLETKGLTTSEIEDALSRAKNGASSSSSAAEHSAPPSAPQASYGYAQQMAPPSAPPRPRLDWKDYFIAAVVAGGLGYGLYVLAKRYVVPLLQARDDNERLLEERKVLVEQNEQTRAQLTALNETTTKVLEALATQSSKTNEAIEGMTALLDKVIEREGEQGVGVRRLQIAIEDVQREVANVAKKERDSGSIADVQSDIRSLRSLLLSRRVPQPVRPGTPGAPPVSSAAVSPDMRAVVTPPVTVEDVPESAASSTTGLGVSESSAAAPESADGSSISNVPTPTIPAWQLGGN